MGQQVNFFWHGDDEREFFEAARGLSGELRVLRYASQEETFERLDALPPIGEPGAFHLWLWDQAKCAPPVARWIAQQRYFTIDPSASEVIELSRSYERDGRLVRGRLWAETAGVHLDRPTEIFQKSPSFQAWFKALLRWVRSHYTRLPDGSYLGPRVKDLQANGAQLSHLDTAPVVKLFRH